jgi:uncharacterized membrane protein
MSDYEVINPKKMLLVLVLISYVAIRVWHLSHFAFGFDEIFSIGVAKMSWGSMMRAIVADLVHPPLFYILLKLWIWIGGTSAFWLRLLPCILSLLIVVPLQGLCNELMLPKLAVATVFILVTFNQLLILYSQELRMYSLLALLSTTSIWLFIRFITGKKDYVVFGFLLVTNLVMIYTHYYGWVYIGSQFVVMCIWTYYRHEVEKLKLYLLSLPILGIAFLPWAIAVIRAIHICVAPCSIHTGGINYNLDWIRLPSREDIVSFYYTLDGVLPFRHATPIALFLFMLPVVLAFRTTRRLEVATLGVFAFLPTAIGIVTSYILPYSVFGPRFLIGCVIPYLLMIVMSVYLMTSFRRSMSTILVLWTIWAGISFVRISDRKVAWNVVAKKIGSNAPVYTTQDYVELPLTYYGVKNILLQKQDVPDKDFIFVYRESRRENPKEVWETQGYGIVDTASESGRAGTIVILHLHRRYDKWKGDS